MNVYARKLRRELDAQWHELAALRDEIEAAFQDEALDDRAREDLELQLSQVNAALARIQEAAENLDKPEDGKCS